MVHFGRDYKRSKLDFVWMLMVYYYNSIPIGIQCFKFASIAFFPFGKEVVYGGGAVSLIANIFWLILSGIPMAIGYLCLGILLSITIIGIPFGKQMFKLAKLSLMPFGASVQRI